MGIVGWLILGLVAGAIARLLVPGRDPLGWGGTLLLGLAGSLLGGSSPICSSTTRASGCSDRSWGRCSPS